MDAQFSVFWCDDMVMKLTLARQTHTKNIKQATYFIRSEGYEKSWNYYLEYIT